MDCLTPQDATRFWLSRRACNDLFLLYCFDDPECPTTALRSALIARSASIPDLRLRIRDHRFAYPSWEPCAFDDEQIVVHTLDDPLWMNVEAALGELLGFGVPAERYVWRLHIFRGIADAPGGAGPALVIVLQLSHALADGRRAAEIARALLSELAVESDGSQWNSTNCPTAGCEPPTESAGFGAARDGVTLRSDELGAGPLDFRVERAGAGREQDAGTARRSHGRVRESASDVEPVPGGDSSSVVEPDEGLEVAEHLASQVNSVLAEAVSLMLLPVRVGRTIRGGLAAARAERELARLTTTGEIPPPAAAFEPTLFNRPPAPARRVVRMIVGEDLHVPGYTVTVVALTAISVAMSRYLAAYGAAPERLGAQVSMAMSGPAATPSRERHSRPSRAGDADRGPDRLPGADRPGAALPVYAAAYGARKGQPRNNYRDIAVDLSLSDGDLRRRATAIANSLSARRARAAHPLQSRRDRVTDTLPAPILRRDLANFPMDLVPDRISGHTVVSSVHRGPADLSIAGAPVRFTAGFPALGAVMHLTHGLHGLGNTTTLSIHIDPQAVPDVDEYPRLLRAALRETISALHQDS